VIFQKVITNKTQSVKTIICLKRIMKNLNHNSIAIHIAIKKIQTKNPITSAIKRLTTINVAFAQKF